MIYSNEKSLSVGLEMSKGSKLDRYGRPKHVLHVLKITLCPPPLIKI